MQTGNNENAYRRGETRVLLEKYAFRRDETLFAFDELAFSHKNMRISKREYAFSREETPFASSEDTILSKICISPAWHATALYIEYRFLLLFH